MSSWLANAIADASQVDDWLSEKRGASLKLLQENTWPTRKTEAWKYTPINCIERASFTAKDNVAEEKNIAHDGPAIEGLESIELVFVDGQFIAEQSTSELPAGLTINSLQEATDWAHASFSAIKPNRHFFGLINDTLATQGCIIDVAADCTITKPIHIIQSFSQGTQSHIRVLMRLGTNASASVIEHLKGDNLLSLNTSFAEYDIADGARLEHYRLAMQIGSAISVGGSHFRLGESAHLDSNLIGFGSQLSRVDMDIVHAGEKAFSKLNVIYLLDGREQFDLHSCIEHTKPYGTSEENVRCIVADHSNAVFNGRIHIHRDAQKILAEMNNKNLLMSDNAQINTKPELEIYADDVRCAHGATIAEIDNDALFYLQSRGVSRSNAQIMLSFGFINELVDQMKNQVIAEWLRPQLRQRFANMEIV